MTAGLESDKAQRAAQQALLGGDGIADARTLYIATVRKDGSQSTAVPVWFTRAPDGAILIQTAPASWLTRRVQRGSPVIVWIGKPDGFAFAGRAECTSDPVAVERIIADYRRKYLLARLGIHRPTARSFAQGRRIAIRITPTHSLPQGLRPNPERRHPKESVSSTND